ncbi:MAG: DUF4115 domain-containing protein [Gammaproteobacteria bacterium]|nr:DUF4115 domain-containing protein [Gammaproteobacteria bacterium]
MSNSDSDIKDTKYDFGSVLSESRKSQKYTVDEISRYLKIPEPVILAIEASDTASLPPPTFAKGYIRAYAKFLEISEDKVLDLYNRAVPQSVAKLKSRSNLPNERNSQSPLIKTVTIFLIIAGIAALIYGGFEYYQEKASVLENERVSKEPGFTGSSLDSPGIRPAIIEQNAQLTDDDELIVESSAAIENTVEEGEVLTAPVIPEPAQQAVAEPAPAADAAREIEQEAGRQTGNIEENQDTIEFYAENGSWMEVRDANDKRLFYNLLPEGGSRTLHGTAPFYVSLGNARTTKVVINGLDVDMTDHIRANNTARFKVSSEQQLVIFH